MIYNNYSDIIQLAKTSTSINDFRKKSQNAYHLCRKNKIWLLEVKKIIGVKRKDNGFWSDEKLIEESKKYKFYSEIKSENNTAFVYLDKKGLLDKTLLICDIRRKITKSHCIDVAKKYNCKSDFEKGDIGCYSFALRNNILSEVCTHMEPKGNILERYIYLITFNDNSVYIGLTWNLSKRKEGHSTKGTVFNEINKGNTIKNYYFLEETPLPEKEAQLKEVYYINKYKEDGYNVLNKDKGGGLGFGKVIWTIDKIKEVVTTCSSRSEFEKLYPTAYEKTRKMNLLDEYCSHMKYDFERYNKRKQCP